jgi:hypothetical protein
MAKILMPHLTNGMNQITARFLSDEDLDLANLSDAEFERLSVINPYTLPQLSSHPQGLGPPAASRPVAIPPPWEPPSCIRLSGIHAKYSSAIPGKKRSGPRLHHTA